MARTSVQTGGTNSFQTSAEDLNRVATDILIDGIVGAVTNTSGVAPTTGGLSVNAQGSPNTTTAIGAGIAYVTATPTSQGSQRLAVKIDAQNVTHASNTSGATRYDWIYIKVDPTLAANPAVAGDTTGTIFVSRSTSSSVDNGTPPTYGYNIAVVTLANSFATVVNGNIADKRVQTGATASGITSSAIVSSRALSNPYSFRVYLATAQNTINGFTRVLCDTKSYDTGTNVDVATNKGRFTAPVAGFYQFNGSVNIATGATYTSVALYKNGALASQGSQHASSAVNSSEVVADKLQLAANDYVELFVGAAAVVAITTGTAYSYFSGHLISAT